MRGAGPLGRAPSPPPIVDDGDHSDDAVHVHFPVEIEIRTTPATIDVEELVDRALRKLARGVAATR